MGPYNIPHRKPPLGAVAIYAPLIGSERLSDASPVSRPSVVSVGAAMVLHAAACVFLLLAVRQPQASPDPDELMVSIVFAPAAPILVEPPNPAPTPASAELPVPPPAALAATDAPQPNQIRPPDPEPRVETKPSDAPLIPASAPVLAALRVVHKATPGVRAAPRVAEAKPSSPLPPSDVPAPTGPAQEAVASPIALEWQHSLAAWLARNKTYPDVARRRGTEGKVVLRFTVDRAGRALDVVLVRSAGSAVLDAAAEDILRDATLPPFAAGMSQDRVTVTVQIRYGLRD